MKNSNERKFKKSTRFRKTLFFYEDNHTYVDDCGENYISVTSLKKKFFPDFDEIKIAKEMSERSGDPVDFILKYWKTISDLANIHGTNVHFACEEYIKNKNIIKFDKKKTNDCCIVARDFIDKEVKNVVTCEKILFSPSLKIAGQVDLISRDCDCLIIDDWKTNKKISKSSFDDEVGLYPFEDFPNSDFWHYVYQLNMYLYIIVSENYYNWAKRYKLRIFHVKDKVVIYDIPIIQDKIQRLIDSL